MRAFTTRMDGERLFRLVKATIVSALLPVYDQPRTTVALRQWLAKAATLTPRTS